MFATLAALNNRIVIFLKAQLSAFTGGVADYVIMIALTEFAGLFYTWSICISGILGAIVNFSLNRYWAFRSIDEKKRTQLTKFVVVVVGSIALKSSGTYLLTQTFGLDYRISRLCIDAAVSLGFNFTMQKYWVFRQRPKP